MLGFAGVFFEIAPQAHNEIINRPRIGVFVQPPDIPQNRAARDGAALVLYQVAQQLRLHQRQLNCAVLGAKLERFEINGLPIEAKNFSVLRSRLNWPSRD